jgi:nicotinamidase-related amidase
MHADTFHRGRPDRQPIVQAVGKVIDEAMANECPVVFVKFHDNSQVVPQLWDKAEGYPARVLVTKYAFSGARKIKDACLDNQFSTSHFRLCGVAADVCVRSTAAELCKLYPQSRVEVLTYACDPPEGGWKRYKKGWAARVHLIRQPASDAA